MGDFLSVPNKDKESEDNENNDVNLFTFLLSINKSCFLLICFTKLIVILNKFHYKQNYFFDFIFTNLLKTEN